MQKNTIQLSEGWTYIMKNFVKKFIKEEQGQGMTEYGLILGVIAIGALGVLTLFGDALTAKVKEVIREVFPNFTIPETTEQ